MLKLELVWSRVIKSRKKGKLNGFVDSISGLGKAFIQAGAKDVVMSLWSVDDEATKNLMVSFYEQIKEQEEKPNYAKALKEAKLKMIREGKHPFYWGGFVVLGL